MGNLRDRLKHLITRGELSEPFQIRDITQGNQGPINVAGREYEVKSIQTTLANHSIGPGDRQGQAVATGQAIYFHKHLEPATYSLFEEDAEDNRGNLDEVTNEGVPVVPCSGEREPDRIANDFIEYLREKPFRIVLHRGDSRTWYPQVPVVGWQNRLDSYFWGSAGWSETKKITDKFVEEIKHLEVDRADLRNRLEDVGGIYKRVAEWGNPRATPLPDNIVLNHLDNVWRGSIDIVNSTLTKLYAFARPDEYVIYDSRVGTAILSIAEDLYRYRTFSIGNSYVPAGSSSRIESVDLYFRSAYSKIGRYDGAGGSRPRGFRYKRWPTGYRSVEAQLEANDLCCRIVSRLNELNEDARNNWNLREVEAVLFMEGY